jgi:hypothetical protein
VYCYPIYSCCEEEDKEKENVRKMALR